MSSSLRRCSSRRAVSFEAKLGAPTTDAVVAALDARRVPEDALTAADWPLLSARLGVPAEACARRTPLHALCAAASDAAVRHVVRQLAADANGGARKRVAALWLARDAAGCTPLHAFALRVPACDALTRFVVKRVAESARDALSVAEAADDDTPAHYFAAAGNAEGVRACLRAAPQLEAAVNARGETPRALESEHTAAANATLRHEVAALRQTVLDEQELRLFMRHANDEIEARDARIQQLEAANEKARGRIAELESTVKGKEVVERDAVAKRRAAERAMQHAERTAAARETELEERAAELAAAERELAELRGAEQRAAAAESALARAEAAEAALDAARHDASAARRALDAERAAADAGDIDAQTRLEVAQRALEHERERVAELEARASETDAARAAAERARTALAAERERDAARAAALGDALAAAERALEAERERVAELEAVEDELDAALTEARRDAAARDAAAADEAERLEERADELAAERDAAATRAAELEEAHRRAICERATLDARRDSEQCRALETKAASLAAELDAARAATGAHSAALEAARTEADAARAAAEAQAAAAEARVGELERELADAAEARSALAAAEAERERLRTDVGAREQRVAEQRAALDDARAAVDAERARVAELEGAARDAQLAEAAAHEQVAELRAALDAERGAIEKSSGDIERVRRECDAARAEAQAARAAQSRGAEELEQLRGALDAERATVEELRADRRALERAAERSLALATAPSEPAAAAAPDSPALRALADNGLFFANVATCVAHGDTDTLALLLGPRLAFSANTCDSRGRSYVQIAVEEAVRLERMRAASPTTFATSEAAAILERLPETLRTLLAHGGQWTGLEAFVDEERHGVPAGVSAVLAQRDSLSPFVTALLAGSLANMITHAPRMGNPNHVPTQFTRATDARLRGKDATYTHIALELWQPSVVEQVGLLAERDGIDFNRLDALGRAPLHVVLRRAADAKPASDDEQRCVELVELLLAYGADPTCVCYEPAIVLFWAKRATELADGSNTTLAVAAAAAREMRAAKRVTVSLRSALSREARAEADSKRDQRLAAAARQYCTPAAMAQLTANERLRTLTAQLRFRRVSDERLAGAVRDRALMHASLVRAYRAGQLAGRGALVSIFEAVQHVLHHFNPHAPRDGAIAASATQRVADERERNIVSVVLMRHGDGSRSSTPRAQREPPPPAVVVSQPAAATVVADDVGAVPALTRPPPLARRATVRSGIKNGTLRVAAHVTPSELARFRVTLERERAECAKGTDVHLLVETLLKSVEVLADRHYDVDDRIYRSATARFDAAVRRALRALVGDEGNPQALGYVLGRADGLFGEHATLEAPLDDGLTCVQLAVARGYVAKVEWALRRDERVLAQRTRDGASIGALAVQHKQPLVLVAIDYHVACRERAALEAAAADENTGVDETERRLRSASGRSAAASDDGSATTTPSASETAAAAALPLASLTAENCAADHRRDYGMKTASGATVLHLCVHQCRDDLLAFCLASVGFHRDTECRGDTPLAVAERRLGSEAGGTLSDAERTSLRRCAALLRNETLAPAVAHAAHTATRERRANSSAAGHVPNIAMFPVSDSDSESYSGASTTDTPRRRHRHRSRRHRTHKPSGERSESRRRRHHSRRK